MKYRFFEFTAIPKIHPVTPQSKVYAAIEKGDLSEMLAIIAKHPSIFSKKGNNELTGTTLLQIAIYAQQLAIIEYLLDKDWATTESTSSLGITPLIQAIPSSESLLTNRSLVIVKTLLKRGANPNIADNEGETPLHKAARLKNTAILEELLTMSVNINAVDSLGCTPLHIACNSSCFNAAKLLCAKGADAYLVNKLGMLASHMAERNKGTSEYNQHIEFLDKLPWVKKRKESKEIKETSLHRAVWFQDADAIIELVRAGANIEAKDEEGKRAEDLTRRDDIKLFLQRSRQKMLTLTELRDRFTKIKLSESPEDVCPQVDNEQSAAIYLTPRTKRSSF